MTSLNKELGREAYIELSWVRVDSSTPLAFTAIFLIAGHFAQLITYTSKLSVHLPFHSRMTVKGLAGIESGTTWFRTLDFLLLHSCPLLKVCWGPPQFKLWWERHSLYLKGKIDLNGVGSVCWYLLQGQQLDQYSVSQMFLGTFWYRTYFHSILLLLITL